MQDRSSICTNNNVSEQSTGESAHHWRIVKCGGLKVEITAFLEGSSGFALHDMSESDHFTFSM